MDYAAAPVPIPFDRSPCWSWGPWNRRVAFKRLLQSDTYHVQGQLCLVLVLAVVYG